MMRHHEEEHGGRGTPVYADDVQEMRRALAAARAASREMSTMRQEGRVMRCAYCGVLASEDAEGWVWLAGEWICPECQASAL